MKEEIKNILRAPLEDVMHDSFMPYAEYVILERAIPRVEDGLKPVQRHILYSMYEMQILPTSGHKKCARIVGDTMGKYHPHGDSSIYEALARMAQDFSMGATLIDGQGNFGSIDGDGPAAMRYTEARLSPIALEMLRDLDKDTVPFQLNFDDSLREPVILPSRFPNLLVNGATGIAVGLATNIPPHNLKEVINGVCYRIKHPKSSLKDIMKFVKGPDFPTGGILMAGDGLKEAYETGKGKITIRAKVEIEKGKNGKNSIVITELPYEIREAAMLKKIESLRETRKDMFSGISDIRSETDRTGIRATIELRNGADPQKILDCLYKYSDLQISYGINMVAIADGQPKTLGLLSLLDYYIEHQKTVVRNRLQFDKEAFEERSHKLEGLIQAVINIDEVIKIVRNSENAREARLNLMKKLNITGVQAQAILDLRLARLTKLEVITLEQEYDELYQKLQEINSILHSKALLEDLIISEMGKIAAKYGIPRRTKLTSDSGEIFIDENEFKVKEDYAVILTRGGNLKRITRKLLARSTDITDVDFKNLPKEIIETETDDRLWLFTDLGNVFNISTESIKEGKYRDSGSQLSSIVAGVTKGETIIFISKPAEKGDLIFVTSQGKIKRTEISAFAGRKAKMNACGLDEGDGLIYIQEDDQSCDCMTLFTLKGMAIRFDKKDISSQGKNAKGVGAITLAKDDKVISAYQTGNQGNVICFTNEGFTRQASIVSIPKQNRNGKGVKIIIWNKDGSNGAYIAGAYYIDKTVMFEMKTDLDLIHQIPSSKIAPDDKVTSGIQLVPVMGGENIVQIVII